MTEWEVFFWLKLDELSVTFEMFAWIALIALVARSIYVAVKASHEEEISIKSVVKLWGVMLFVAFLSCLIPSSKEYALIKVLPKVANSDFSKQVPEDMQEMYSMAKDYLKEKLSVKKETKDYPQKP